MNDEKENFRKLPPDIRVYESLRFDVALGSNGSPTTADGRRFNSHSYN